MAIVSAINHPDIGALKRAIEINAQRKVTVVKPNDIKSLQDFTILILYQPTTEFKSVFEDNKLTGINTFVITGNNTDFNFLNQNQDNFTFKMSGSSEDYLAMFDTQFNLFAMDNIGFEKFPPLENSFGAIKATGNVNNVLSSSIRNIETNQSLLSFVENKGKRNAYLFGENIWKWRADYFVEHKNFTEFDVFLDKTIQYLSTNNSRKSLVVSHERFYNSGDALEITAQYFNKNFNYFVCV